jgi:hypothetical protein
MCLSQSVCSLIICTIRTIGMLPNASLVWQYIHGLNKLAICLNVVGILDISNNWTSTIMIGSEARTFIDRTEHLWSKKNIQSWSGKLAIGTTLIYALCGGLSANAEHPTWYRVLTSCILLNLALLVSALLCLRNGFSQRISSDRTIWSFLGLALLSFFFGSIFFSSWELIWGLNPAGSLGDPFFLLFYIFLPAAMLLAIFRKRVRLETFQWFFLLSIASFATLIVTVFVILAPPITATAPATVPAIEATTNASSITTAPAIAKAEESAMPEC